MAWRQLEFAIALIFGSGLLFYPALWLPRRARTVTCGLLLLGILATPLLIDPRAKFLRLMAVLSAVTVGVKLYDQNSNAQTGYRPSFWEYVTSLPNPFALVFLLVKREKPRPKRADSLQMAIGLMAGSIAILLTVWIFQIDWRRHSIVAEHCAKAIGLFLVIQFLPNGLAAGLRFIGICSTDFSGAFFLARTPAEFWRLYNRPAEQFFRRYVFQPAHGRRHPLIAALITFAVSGIIHEYVFDLPASRVLGYQMAFFIVQGLTVTATLRVRPRGAWAIPAVLLTFAFNLAIVRIFLASMNAVLPFYTAR